MSDQRRSFKDDILEEAGDEAIIKIVIGDNEQDRSYRTANLPLYKHIIGKVITWEKAAPILDYAYDAGYGGTECHAITAWTKNYVIFVSEYDGSTSLEKIPRRPIPHSPIMPGGG